MSIKSDIRQKERDISNLQKYKKDLTDDTSDITEINKLVVQMQEDFQNFIVSDNTRNVVEKIGDLLEPYQSSDSDLNSACNYIDSEISKLRSDIAALERALEATARAKAALEGK